MTSHSMSESSDFCWRSPTKEALSSERLDEGARPVFSKQFVLTSDGIQHFVPEYIREKFHEPIEPNLCSLKAVCKANEKQNQEHVTTDSNTSTSKFKKSPISEVSRTELKQQRLLQSPETTVEVPLTGQQTRHCDGPCGKMRSVKELQVHGQCEHAICQLCINNAPMIKNIDGTIGCCNQECFAADLAALCPDPVLQHKYFQKIINKDKINEIIATLHENRDYNMKRLQRAMDSSRTSQISSMRKSNRGKQGLKELMCVKVLILEKGPMGTICRRRSVGEIGSTESLRSTLQWVVGPGQNLHKSRIFFNYDENAKDSKLKEIDLKQYGDKKISSFPSTNGMLNFVVDSTNHISRNSTSSYI